MLLRKSLSNGNTTALYSSILEPQAHRLANHELEQDLKILSFDASSPPISVRKPTNKPIRDYSTRLGEWDAKLLTDELALCVILCIFKMQIPCTKQTRY
jgi:hypothetical protein